MKKVSFKEQQKCRDLTDWSTSDKSVALKERTVSGYTLSEIEDRLNKLLKTLESYQHK